MINIHILTLFPEFFDGPFNVSIIKRACDKGLINIDIINIRDFLKINIEKSMITPMAGDVEWS